jgi:hypothetical protein
MTKTTGGVTEADVATHGLYVSYRNPEHGTHCISKGTHAQIIKELWALDNVAGKYEEFVEKCPLGAPHAIKIHKLH